MDARVKPGHDAAFVVELRANTGNAEETPCPTPKPCTPCSPPRGRPTRSSSSPARLRYDALPEDARHYARRHLLDTVGVMIAGRRRHHRDAGRERHQGGAAGGENPGARPRAARRPARRGVSRRHRGARHRTRRRLPARLGALRLRHRPGGARGRPTTGSVSGRALIEAVVAGYETNICLGPRLRAGPPPARLPSDQRGRAVRRRDGDRQAARAERAAIRQRARHRGVERRRACSPSSPAAATSSGCTPDTRRARACRRRCSPSKAPKARRT